jgi:hypothetical protein
MMETSSKRHPIRAAIRADVAQGYRKIRKDNPAIARLLYRRARAAEAAMVDLVLRGEPHSSLSDALFGEGLL